MASISTETRSISLPNTTFVVGDRVIKPVSLNRTWNTTTVNQLLGLPGMFSTYTKGELLRLRGIAITSSSLSIIFAFFGIFLILCIDKRRKVFRHHLIFFLISCDLLKALVLLIYPIAILCENRVYGFPAFYNTLGWFTSFAIEGADFAIAIFAIHFALLIFVPSWKWQNKSTGNMEGGLYYLRHYLIPVTFLLPMILASLAFIEFNSYIPVNVNDKVILDNNKFGFRFQARVGGYKAMSAWCYLAPRPWWYRLVLSWGPRYFIIILIFTIYISIYVFVSRENRKIKNQIGSFRYESSVNIHGDRDSKGRLLSLNQRLMLYFKYATKKLGIRKVVRSVVNFFFLYLEDYNEEDGEISNQDENFESLTRVCSLGAVGESAGLPQHSSGNQYPALGAQRPQMPLRGNSPTPNYPKRIPTRRMSSSTSPRALSSVLLGPEDAQVAHSTSNGSRNSNLNYANHENHNTTEPKQINGAPYNDAKKPGTVPRGKKTEGQGYGTRKSGTGPSGPVGGESADDRSEAGPSVVALDPNHIIGLQQNFQSETYQDFKKRRAQIQKQLRSIFIYPCSYVIIWTFPFIVDVVQYHNEVVHGPIVWLSYIATFMQPFSCCVDVLVFVYRERPWRHSWAAITRKELYNNYSLKGEIGEQAIREICNSEMGKRGWFFRGRWSKLECWRHKPQRWKRVAWFCYRFFKGFVKNDYNFDDRCNDAAYWDEYYLGKRAENEHPANTRLRCSEALKEVLDIDNVRKGSYISGSTGEIIYENQGYVRIPLLWRLVHMLPMLEGIDLDELDYEIRSSQHRNNLDIPGLNLALQNITQYDSTGAVASVFKPDYDMTNIADQSSLPNNNFPPRPPPLHRSKYSSSRTSQISQSPFINLTRGSTNDQRVTSSSHAGVSGGQAGRTSLEDESLDQANNQDEASGDTMDFMDFLKG
ncbi:LADA_0B08064g1_1 [Lachancea dasiensis]|uniref:LADA_0B08064g1_1 n=1 Tax=Lachancea dasiensis TaxID=1072105 RepID=A0A1G4IUS9_9SACH|nr:LADA_0B08064g1_1 [Lachancea dasiensis]